MRSLLPIIFAVLISAIGYGISFPLIGFRLEQTGASGLMIGVNTAMPAIGWIVGSVIVPLLQLRSRIGIASLAAAFLMIATVALVGLRYSDEYDEMTALRFFFGGAMGMFYRSVEYWMNALSSDTVRARNLSVNGVAFMLGIIIGSAIQPSLGTDGWTAFGPILALLVIAVLSIGVWPHLAPPTPSIVSFRISWSYIAVLPIAYIAALAYGLDESVPAYLAQIYALKNGLSPEIAAYTLTAAALGNILIPIPIALGSDRIGRKLPLAACALMASAASLAIPYSLANPLIFLALLLVCAGAAGAIYGLSLAMIGDRFRGPELVIANSAFGLVYAAGSIVGPILNGAALDTLNTHGLMVASALIFGSLSVILIGRSAWGASQWHAQGRH